MNRRILFRGKRADNGEWETGCFIKSLSSTIYGYIKESNSPAAEEIKVVLKTVGQFTGLTDSYDTKIFEGDIVWDELNERRGIVKFMDGEFIVEFDGYIDSERFADVMNCCYVEGNIYDNTELLEGAHP